MARSVTWNAISNVTYSVQYKSDLNDSTWTDLSGDVLTSSTTATKTDLRTGTNRLYRVKAL